jgi:hypothetical protein
MSLTPEQVREALGQAQMACDWACSQVAHKDEVGDCAWSDAAAILRRLLDSGFVEKAMALATAYHAHETGEVDAGVDNLAVAIQDDFVDSFRRFQSDAKKEE